MEAFLIDNILEEIDAEIAWLQQARRLFAAMDSKAATPGTTRAGVKAIKPKKQPRRSMSAEGRERIRQVQIKRWA